MFPGILVHLILPLKIYANNNVTTMCRARGVLEIAGGALCKVYECLLCCTPERI